ncbi:meso-butanediol dehydrogenase/(S,S)-butanediol dehydrogenase/diacetyl reductase [Kitasatospora sp. MAP12-15]|uniref:SDR family oxidoreductase n=1 Tax=unclassified Kitasatospora TaxID=2633591 RepID=UPI0024762253|nr:SDR family NAD(P)-dependent oxidoreductase [Kitasatospora sp. MAP12-44]MDH6115453.1 meso-butanediol dehydrogenase/(S,S)-butanediol dehydrogenase/diacetyl reductase [Kitasatospora sp. MAP12-44]
MNTRQEDPPETADAHRGKVVLVVGGGRGMGRAVVEAFALRGARVVVADTDHLASAYNHYRSAEVGGFAAAGELAAELRDRGCDVTAVAADAADEGSVQALLATVGERYGQLDTVVNAFGVTHVCTVEQMELAEFTRVIEGNLNGVFLVSKHALPLLRADGGGSIVNFSSVSGRSGFAKVAHYCAAKFGVIGFTAALALEEARNGVRVNAVCPGIVRTNMWNYLLEEFTRPGETEEECWERMRMMIPQREFQQPQDIAELVLFLASARRITGQAVSVDGGMSAP